MTDEQIGLIAQDHYTAPPCCPGESGRLNALTFARAVLAAAQPAPCPHCAGIDSFTLEEIKALTAQQPVWDEKKD